MKICDYIVEYMESKGVRDVFGYPGGMVTYLMDAFDRASGISQHLTYHEQAAAFCACATAQLTGVPGVAYATSGPGATNLMTGIANAFFDSIPAIFITGQVNRNECMQSGMRVRQRGFQETNIVDIARPVTKFSAYLERPEDIKLYLDQAFYYATEGRKGPCLLDIPIDIFRADISPDTLQGFEYPAAKRVDYDLIVSDIKSSLERSARPVIIAGNGIHTAHVSREFRDFASQAGIPVITSMLAVDLLEDTDPCRMGFLGAYGQRCANFAVYHSDLIIAMGSRLDMRQTGAELSGFTKAKKLIRIDIDEAELQMEICPGQMSYPADLKNFLPVLAKADIPGGQHSKWLEQCVYCKEKLAGYDKTTATELIAGISEFVPEGRAVTTDVGQNQVWVAQAFRPKKGQRILFSGGHGAMGYSLPAAIGAYYATGQPVFCFTGDGGLQMNIQELQFIAREGLPVKIILLNNNALGMIRHFQEMYFSQNYAQTVEGKGYLAPQFTAVADAYGIRAAQVRSIDDIEALKSELADGAPLLVEVLLSGPTYVFPKLAYGKPICEQEPPLDKGLFASLEEIFRQGEDSGTN